MNARTQPSTDFSQLVSIEMMLKATPVQEGAGRFIYLEASREARDQQNDIVLAKALEASADHYLKFGNIDIDHKSMPAIAKMMGIEKPHLWEIGAPVDVRIDGVSTFVKAQLFTGDSDQCENANMVWDSMTRMNPPRKWYPSVGGKILAKSMQIDPATGDKLNVVSGVRWTNIAVSQQPVNQHVGGIQTIPFDVLAKSWTSEGLDMAKALEASYATDAAGKTGGAAFGAQSLDMGITRPVSYHAFREDLAKALRSGQVTDSSADGLISFGTNKLSLTAEEAGEWVDRFISDIKRGLPKFKRSAS